jgi:FkbM family methyltransferase
MPSTVRDLARTMLPAPVRTPIRRFETYARRLAAWAAAAGMVRGVGASDRTVLRAALWRSPLDSARGLDRWRDPVLPADAEVDVRGIGRFRVRGGSDDFYHVLPSREPAVVAAIRAHVRSGDCFVDAGANIGFYTVLAGRCAGPDGRVIAIEMLPQTAAILRGHVAANSLHNVQVVEGALSDRDGETLRAHVVEGRFGQASVVTRQEHAREIAVATVTLATVLADLPRVRLMKLDLEGAEPAALRGARAILPRVDAVILETHRQGSEAEVLLVDAGFRIRRLDGRNLIAERGGGP